VTPLIVTVTPGTCPTFTLTPASTTVNVASGGTIAATLTLASINGFAGTVFFTAWAVENTGVAPGFSFNPASFALTSSGASSSTTVTVTLTGITASLHRPGAPGDADPGTMPAGQTPGRGRWFAAGSGVTVASLLLLTLPRRRRLGGLLMVALAAALVGGASGCGSSGQAGPPTTSSNPDAGQYYVTVIGTSGSTVVASSTITFNVQ
jgi:hypothetical protein